MTWVKKEDLAAEPCTRLHVQNAALKLKYPSNQHKADQYTAENAIKNTDDRNKNVSDNSASFPILVFGKET